MPRSPPPKQEWREEGDPPGDLFGPGDFQGFSWGFTESELFDQCRQVGGDPGGEQGAAGGFIDLGGLPG